MQLFLRRLLKNISLAGTQETKHRDISKREQQYIYCLPVTYNSISEYRLVSFFFFAELIFLLLIQMIL